MLTALTAASSLAQPASHPYRVVLVERHGRQILDLKLVFILDDPN